MNPRGTLGSGAVVQFAPPQAAVVYRLASCPGSGRRRLAHLPCREAQGSLRQRLRPAAFKSQIAPPITARTATRTGPPTARNSGKLLSESKDPPFHRHPRREWTTGRARNRLRRWGALPRLHLPRSLAFFVALVMLNPTRFERVTFAFGGYRQRITLAYPKPP